MALQVPIAGFEYAQVQHANYIHLCTDQLLLKHWLASTPNMVRYHSWLPICTHDRLCTCMYIVVHSTVHN